MPIIRRRRATNHIEVDTEGSWAISYGDMVTLLLSFFILFFSTDHSKERLERLDASLFAKLQSNANFESRTPSGEDPVFEARHIQELRAHVHKVGQKIIVEFPQVSFFNFGKIALTKEGTVELEKFVKVYMPYAGNFIVGIRAYTDNKKVKSTSAKYADNLELSALRSVATMRILQKEGIPLNRMRLGGFGELRLTAEELSRAIASNPTFDKNGLALARKVVIVIEPEPKENL